MNILKKGLWIVCCVAVFFGVFVASAFTKFVSMAGFNESDYTLQGETSDETIGADGYKKEIVSVSYVTNEGQVDSRPIVIYRPPATKGDLPLIFVPHYAIEENSADFRKYMARGWIAASPTEFRNEYNGRLATDDLAFNNAALYTLRNMEGVDRQRIAIVGGSAGGYTALMLSELQMGTCATVANSPVANLYYNFAEHFPKCDEVNRNAGAFRFPILIQGLVSKLFRPIKDGFSGADDPRWVALSPVGMVKCVGNPVVVNHFTGDILVPVDQISKRYTYEKHDGSLPDDFPVRMKDDYPSVLSRSLEEEADPAELSVRRYKLEDRRVDMDMPYGDVLLTINVFDDGPISARSAHTAPGVVGFVDSLPFLEEMFSRTLAKTEKAPPAKIKTLLDRYLGRSVQLPAHEDVDASVYGSLAVYRKEVVDELTQYALNHSLTELNNAVVAALEGSENENELSEAWTEIKDQITFRGVEN